MKARNPFPVIYWRQTLPAKWQTRMIDFRGVQLSTRKTLGAVKLKTINQGDMYLTLPVFGDERLRPKEVRNQNGLLSAAEEQIFLIRRVLEIMQFETELPVLVDASDVALAIAPLAPIVHYHATTLPGTWVKPIAGDDRIAIRILTWVYN